MCCHAFHIYKYCCFITVYSTPATPRLVSCSCIPHLCLYVMHAFCLFRLLVTPPLHMLQFWSFPPLPSCSANYWSHLSCSPALLSQVFFLPCHVFIALFVTSAWITCNPYLEVKETDHLVTLWGWRYYLTASKVSF